MRVITISSFDRNSTRPPQSRFNFLNETTEQPSSVKVLKLWHYSQKTNVWKFFEKQQKNFLKHNKILKNNNTLFQASVELLSRNATTYISSFSWTSVTQRHSIHAFNPPLQTAKIATEPENLINVVTTTTPDTHNFSTHFSPGATVCGRGRRINPGPRRLGGGPPLLVLMADAHGEEFPDTGRELVTLRPILGDMDGELRFDVFGLLLSEPLVL